MSGMSTCDNAPDYSLAFKQRASETTSPRDNESRLFEKANQKTISSSRKGVRHESIRSLLFAAAKSLCTMRQANRDAGMGRKQRRPHHVSLALLGLRLSVRGDCLRARNGSAAHRSLIFRRLIFRNSILRRLISRRRATALLLARQMDSRTQASHTQTMWLAIVERSFAKDGCSVPSIARRGSPRVAPCKLFTRTGTAYPQDGFLRINF
jgi:hypothetical protein